MHPTHFGGRYLDGGEGASSVVEGELSMYGAIASSRNAMAAAGHASRADQAIAIVQLYGRALRRSSLGVKLLTWHACSSVS